MEQMKRKQFQFTAKNAKKFNKLLTEDNYLTYFSAIADVELLRYGNYFLGTFASLFSKLVYYIMIGEKLRFIPFVSLDFPLTCLLLYPFFRKVPLVVLLVLLIHQHPLSFAYNLDR